MLFALQLIFQTHLIIHILYNCTYFVNRYYYQLLIDQLPCDMILFNISYARMRTIISNCTRFYLNQVCILIEMYKSCVKLRPIGNHESTFHAGIRQNVLQPSSLKSRTTHASLTHSSTMGIYRSRDREGPIVEECVTLAMRFLKDEI